MMSWCSLSFEDAVEDVSAGNVKTPHSEFLASGAYPIVDQGQRLIAGYSDDPGRLCRAESPVVVFGDHTRCFKYIDFPFCIGADGVRVLRAREGVQTKYLYWCLTQVRLPDGGYDRHYKYLKRATVPLPPLAEQRRIADILDRADAIRAKRREAIALAGVLSEALLVQMFPEGASSLSMTPLGELSEVQGGLQVSHARSDLPVEVPYLRVANVLRGELLLDVVKTIKATPAELERTSLQTNDLLVVEGHGNPDEVGRCALWRDEVRPCVHQNHLIRVRLDRARVAPRYVHDYLNSPAGRRHLIRAGNTTSGLNTISVADVRATPICLPSKSQQDEYTRRVAAIDKLEAAHRASLAEMDALFASLQHRAFRGEL